MCCSQRPCPCGRPLLAHASTGDMQTLKGSCALSLWGLYVLMHKRLYLSPSGYGVLILKAISPPPPPPPHTHTILLGLILWPWTWGIFYGWDPTFSCQWSFNRYLQFWSSHRRWVHILLLCYLGLLLLYIFKLNNLLSFCTSPQIMF